jgi:GDPmannose 4,6-dehydratase
VTQKIIQAARAIAAGSKEKLVLGNLDVWRDWGWAPDYVTAMHMMLAQAEPKDYLIASGNTHSLSQFVDVAFGLADLIADEWVEFSGELLRPTDLRYSAINPSKFMKESGWKASCGLPEIVGKMFQDVLF